MNDTVFEKAVGYRGFAIYLKFEMHEWFITFELFIIRLFYLIIHFLPLTSEFATSILYMTKASQTQIFIFEPRLTLNKRYFFKVMK